MTPEEIEDIAKQKVQDYLESLIINLTLSMSGDPEKLLKEIESEAFIKCNYDDPTIDKELYQQLQAAIKHRLALVFKNISRKANRKFDYL